MYNKVELCGMDTAQLPVLTEAQKRELLTRAHAGDAAARQQMIEGNLRLVQHDAVGAPGLVLLECRRGGKPGLRAEPTLLLYGPDGRETAEHRRAYFREEEQAL